MPSHLTRTTASRGMLAALAAIMLALAGAPSAPSAEAAEQLPPGFTRTAIPSGQGPFQLTDFAMLPGGGFITLGKGGRVQYVHPDGANRQLADLRAYQAGDLGLLGIALGNDYATSGTVYLVHNYEQTDGGTSSRWARLSRYRAQPPASPTSLTLDAVVLDGISADHDYHSIGTVVVDADDSLWLGVGDGFWPGEPGPSPLSLRAQRLDSPHGKILRILPNGDGVPDNPFYEATAPSSWKSRTWAHGLRNPFRFTFDPTSGAMLIADVGWNSREELNLGAPGANYGWPCWEGDHQPPSYADRGHAECERIYPGGSHADEHVEPLWQYRHTDNLGRSITGGVVVSNDTYPEEYRNAYIFGDYVSERMWTAELRPDGTGFARPPEPGDPVTSTDSFGQGLGGMVSFRTGPDGDVYYGDIYTSTIWRLRYSPGNRAPQPRAQVDYEVGDRTAHFRADDSSDPDGDPITFTWDFGDGSPVSTEVAPTHTYPEVATYRATLTVSDDQGASASTELLVALDDHPPELAIRSLNPPGTLYAVGDVISLEAEAVDVEDGPIPAEEISWRTVLDHCPTPSTCHAHPGETGTGAAFSTTFVDHGDDTAFVIHASVTDSLGQETVSSYRAEPDLRTLTVSSNPSGVPLSVTTMGGTHSSLNRRRIDVVVGSENTVSAPSRYGSLEFVEWSNGVDETQQIFAMPREPVRLTARYVDTTPEPEPEPEPATEVDRLSGRSRIETAVALSRAELDHGDVVVIARADDYADALAGGPLAHSLEAPILLTYPNALHAATRAEIQRLDARRVVLLGGEAALSAAVEAQLGDMDGVSVERVSGSNRFETAAVIADIVGGGRAFLVEGINEDPGRGWPDAVAVSALAAHRGEPILLTARDALPAATLDAAAGRLVTVVGGVAAIDDAVAAEVAEVAEAVDRVSGRTRFETSAALLELLRAEQGPLQEIWLASGGTWVDVLAAAPLAGRGAIPILLSDGNDLDRSPPVERILRAESPSLRRVRLIGGEGVMSAHVCDQVVTILDAAGTGSRGDP